MQREYTIPREFERSRISPSQRSVDEMEGEVRERASEREREIERERKLREYRAD